MPPRDVPITREECEARHNEMTAQLQAIQSQLETNHELLTGKIEEMARVVGQIDLGVRGDREGTQPGIHQRLTGLERTVKDIEAAKLSDRLDAAERDLDAVKQIPWAKILLAVLTSSVLLSGLMWAGAKYVEHRWPRAASVAQP